MIIYLQVVNAQGRTRSGIYFILFFFNVLNCNAFQLNHRRWNEPITKYRVVSIIDRIGTLTDKLQEFSEEPAEAACRAYRDSTD